jgi:hypothetical protein
VRHLETKAAVVGMLLLSATATPAFAASPLDIDVQSMLGAGSPTTEGWLSADVRIQNHSSAVVRGTLSVDVEVAWAKSAGSGPHNGTDVPFSVPANSVVSVEVPVHGLSGAASTLRAQATSEQGVVLAEAKTPQNRSNEPLIFDLGSPSHFAPVVRPLSVPLVSAPWGGLASSTIAVSSARRDSRTGEPVVPRMPSGYAPATVVVATALELSLIGEEARAALGDWLLAGGSLAVALEKPEDLRAPALQAWIGGPLREKPALDSLRGESVFAIPIEPGGVPSGRPAGVGEMRITPSPESRARLRSYEGGNLRPTPWGAAASYGLGELHLLAFRPNAEPFVSDPWTHRKLADLARHAWDRRATLALPFAQQTLDEGHLAPIRRELDPNQKTRWMIVVSALLLLVYAGVAGPLNFYWARRRGTPLRALSRLPMLSGLALLLVVALGVLGRGVSGRARRITLIEAGAGMSRAAATRFRGLYAPSARERVVQASARGNVLDATGDAEQTGRRLIVDRDGARLTQLQGRPWEVVVVQEDGFMDLGGGVSLVPAADGTISVKNRLGRDLVGVVLSPGGSRSPRFFPRIKDGELVAEPSGEALPLSASSPLAGGGLKLDGASKQLESASQGLLSAWSSLEYASPRSVEYWPADVPVLVAQLDGGEGKRADSGFPLEVDRALLRVVGTGGLP